MNARQTLLGTSCALVAGVCAFRPGAALASGSSATAQRPNILVYIADDMSWAHTGIGGDPAVKTPNFDDLARSGVRFTHAFCSSPSCTPSRGALLTGQAFCRLEEGASLLSTLPAKLPVYPDLLEQAGYASGSPAKAGTRATGGPAAASAIPPVRSSLRWARSCRSCLPGKPFCFWVGSRDPHRPYDAGSGIASGIDPARIIVPPIVPDTPEIRRDLADYLFEVQRFDQQLAVLLADLETKSARTNTLIVVTSDNGMPYPRGKCSLYDWGTRMPLVIAWPGKIPPNRVIDDFVRLTDLAPTFLEAAGVPRPKEMTGRSLWPMLLSDRSGRVETDRDHVFFGRERHDSYRLENGQPVGFPMRAVRTEQFLYIRNFKPERLPAGDNPQKNQDNDQGPAKTSVVTHENDPAFRPFYLRAYGRRPAEELYDLAKDPGQLTNVAGTAAYSSAQSRLQTELDRWMTAMNDPRRPHSPDPDIFDRYPIRQRPR